MTDREMKQWALDVVMRDPSHERRPLADKLVAADTLVRWAMAGPPDAPPPEPLPFQNGGSAATLRESNDWYHAQAEAMRAHGAAVLDAVAVTPAVQAWRDHPSSLPEPDA